MLAIALASGAAWWFVDGGKESPVGAPRTVRFPPPPIAASEFLNTGPKAQYVGTQSCVACHSDYHASYLQTAHSLSMSRIDPDREPPDGVYDHELSQRRYRTYRHEGQLRHSESLLSPDGGELKLNDYPLEYLVGSGRFSRTYLAEDKGFLVESPLTWYASLGAWVMSPGYDQADHSSFQRSVGHACLYCHASQIERLEQSEERLRLGETAIGCERCHGPGSLHVAKWSAGGEVPDAGDFTIVNPRRLPRDRAEAICHQCHLNGKAQVAVRGRRPSDFRPGLHWQDFALDYTYETASTDMTVTGHVEQLRQSSCYQGSETLTCTTCHDPHAAPAPEERIAYHRRQCVSCHAEPSCGLSQEERNLRNGNDCTACHMPQSSTDIPHLAFTHHRIGIHQPSSPAKRERSAADSFQPLAPLLDVSHLSEQDQLRSLGLAHLYYFRDNPRQPSALQHAERGRELLHAAAKGGMSDPAVTAALAEIAAASEDLPQADHWARQTLESEDPAPLDRVAALGVLATIGMRQGDLRQAELRLDELTKLRRNPRDWFLLGLCRQRQGKLGEAIAALERVQEIDPATAETYLALAPLYRAQGDEERAKWCEERASALRKADSQ